MTTILKPGIVYWIKEISAGPGYTMGDNAKIFAFVSENKNYTVEAENVEIIPYKKNETAYAKASNYKNGPGVGPGNITQDQFDSIVKEENHTITFELVEIKAPERVELLKESYPVTVEFDGTGNIIGIYEGSLCSTQQKEKRKLIK